MGEADENGVVFLVVECSAKVDESGKIMLKCPNTYQFAGEEEWHGPTTWTYLDAIEEEIAEGLIGRGESSSS